MIGQKRIDTCKIVAYIIKAVNITFTLHNIGCCDKIKAMGIEHSFIFEHSAL